jgi:hypothetical protein
MLWSQVAPRKADTVVSRPAEPVIGKAPRYVNPLNIEATSNDGSPQGISLGDPTVVREGNSYYLFATGGGPWVSDDLINWKYAPIDASGVRVPVAPHVVKYNGAFYMSGNGSLLYRSAKILGPYAEIGPWLDEKGSPATFRVFDIDIFVDSDNKPYLYMSAGATLGIWVAPLDPNNLTRITAAPKTLFAFNSAHVWERMGDSNERTNHAYIEGPWVFKRNGIYYLEYSGSGTEWLTYATGVYTARSPLGPFTYMPGNPLLRKTTGVVAGTGHGSVVQSPDGNWWQFYLTVLPTPPGGRRIGMDPIGFEANGNMFVRGGVPTETPQWAPGVVANPARNGDSGSVPLTFGKTRNLISSSQRPGRDPAYALDNSNGTWWEPAEGDVQPSITVDLLQTAPFDQPYTIDSIRIAFRARGGRGFGQGRGAFGAPGVAGSGRGVGAEAPGGLGGAGRGIAPEGRGVAGPGTVPQPQAPFSGSPAFRYKLEVSNDGKAFTTVLNKTNNTVTRYTEFDEIPPTPCRFVRLTVTDWPRSADQPLGISEFTVFGRYVAPAKP